MKTLIKLKDITLLLLFTLQLFIITISVQGQTVWYAGASFGQSTQIFIADKNVVYFAIYTIISFHHNDVDLYRYHIASGTNEKIIALGDAVIQKLYFLNSACTKTLRIGVFDKKTSKTRLSKFLKLRSLHL